MEINEILSIRYDFGKSEMDTCVSSSRITALFYIFIISDLVWSFLIWWVVREQK